MLKKILLLLLGIFVIIQFFRPQKNISTGLQANNISTKYTVPATVKSILEKSCNDCHSNNTRYPWYNTIQPVAWWLKQHVNEGKQHLNFDAFTAMPVWRQHHTLEEIEEQIKENEMPLPSYTWVHKNAILTNAEKEELYNWVAATRAQIQATYPADSLQRPPRRAQEK